MNFLKRQSGGCVKRGPKCHTLPDSTTHRQSFTLTHPGTGMRSPSSHCHPGKLVQECIWESIPFPRGSERRWTAPRTVRAHSPPSPAGTWTVLASPARCHSRRHRALLLLLCCSAPPADMAERWSEVGRRGRHPQQWTHPLQPTTEASGPAHRSSWWTPQWGDYRCQNSWPEDPTLSFADCTAFLENTGFI